MTSNKIKGSLLEYIVRRLLVNCGFTTVAPDGLFVYKQRGLTLVNGRGAAHDADVLLNPPIQFPFIYPTRINFECKAYNKTIGLTIVRNALGLRIDLNDFEIVSRDFLTQRQNTRRNLIDSYDNRQRYFYQVGVATVEEFSKDAIEFAANNKIPLICLRRFLPNDVCNLFHDITDKYLELFEENDLKDLFKWLKGERNEISRLIATDSQTIFKKIIDAIQDLENKLFVGLLESGDLFILSSHNSSNEIKSLLSQPDRLKARLYYEPDNVDNWILKFSGTNVTFNFKLPKRVLKTWSIMNYDQNGAMDLKERFFSKFYIFFNRNRTHSFKDIYIDVEWLRDLMRTPIE